MNIYGKSFSNKEDAFVWLKNNEKDLISFKKNEKMLACNKGQSFNFSHIKDFTAAKSLPFEPKDNFAYEVINTTNYLDSHKDVHLDGVFNKTVKEQAGSVYYVTDHKKEIEKVIVHKSNLQMFVSQIEWSAVGKSYEGTTEALIYAFNKDHIEHAKAKEWILNKVYHENSIAMYYVKMFLAVDSMEKEFAQYKANYDTYSPLIVNKEALEDGFFWGVQELKIAGEGSMVVNGSNDATGMIFTEAAQSTSSNKQEPTQVTQQPKKCITFI